MNFIDDGPDNVDYEFKYRTIIDGNVMNVSLIILKGDYCAVDAGDTSLQSYYIIIFTLDPYTLQEELNIDGQSIYFG